MDGEVDDPAVAPSTNRHDQEQPRTSLQSSPDTRGVPTLPAWKGGELHDSCSSDESDSESSDIFVLPAASEGNAPPYPQSTAGIPDAVDPIPRQRKQDGAFGAGPPSSARKDGLTALNGANVVENSTKKLAPDADIPEVVAGTSSSGTAGDVPSSSQNINSMFSTRGRFRRQRSSITLEESAAALRERFWEGVKPARASSTLLAPPGGTGMARLTMATVRAALKLKKRANVIQAKSVFDKYVLDPRSPRMTYWKNWMIVNIMYTVLIVPWRISFHVEAGAFGLTLSAIANVSFIVDSALRFVTAIPTETGLVTDRRVIVRRYLRTWFIFDAVTCLPLTTLMRNSVPRNVRVLTPMRGLRLLALLKVVKVYAMHYEVSYVCNYNSKIMLLSK